MNFQRDVLKENLVTKLGTLLSKDEFWDTSSIYNRGRSFSFSNNYYAHQVNRSVIDFCKNIKDESSKIKKKSVELCQLYSDYNVKPEEIDILKLINDNLDDLEKYSSMIREGYKEIGKELDKPDPFKRTDYKAIYENVKSISQRMVNAIDMSSEILDNAIDALPLIHQEIESIKNKASSGEIKKNSKILNFLQGKKSSNQKIIESKISKKYR